MSAIRGGAATQHFQNAEPRGPDDEIFGNIARFGRENIFFEPLIEGQIVGNAAEQAHSSMRVTIDQPGHNDGAMGVDHFRCFEVAIRFRRTCRRQRLCRPRLLRRRLQ